MNELALRVNESVHSLLPRQAGTPPEVIRSFEMVVDHGATTMTKTTVITNGTVITSQEQRIADLLIEGETIVAVGQSLRGDEVIDAAGLYVIPGAIDPHVHLAMPAGSTPSGKPLRSRDDWRTGTVAAACGGTTTVIDFIEPEGDESLLAALAARRAEAERDSVIDFSLHMTLTNAAAQTLAEVPDVVAQGVRSFKTYLTYDGFKLDDHSFLKAAQAVGKAGGMLLVHAENDAIIAFLRAAFLAEGKTAPLMHPLSRPADAEGEAVERAIALANTAGCPIYIVHISTRLGAEAVARARVRGQAAWGETCPQYLLLTAAEYGRAGFEGAKFVCSPPLRAEADKTALWSALDAATVQTVGTDHCPFNYSGDKDDGDPANPPPFNRIPGGIPGIESRLALLYSAGVARGRITAERWVDVCCTGPAHVFGLARKGRIAEGCDADLVLFDSQKKHTISSASLHEDCDYTPYEGIELTGYPVLTMSRGRLIARDGQYCGGDAGGRFITR